MFYTLKLLKFLLESMSNFYIELYYSFFYNNSVFVYLKTMEKLYNANVFHSCHYMYTNKLFFSHFREYFFVGVFGLNGCCFCFHFFIKRLNITEYKRKSILLTNIMQNKNNGKSLFVDVCSYCLINIKYGRKMD